MPVPFEGGCRCRAIRYRCTAEPMLSLHCYCRDCQYSSGGACSTAVVTTRDGVTLEGSPAVYTVESEAGTQVSRHFCATCGTPVFATNTGAPALFVLKAATLDDPSWLAPAAHIWTQSAPPWACLTDDLTRFAKNFGAT